MSLYNKQFLDSTGLSTLWTKIKNTFITQDDLVTAVDLIDAAKVDDYSISISAPTGGNPREIKFLTVNYDGTDSNNAIFINLKAIACHPNGTSYKQMEEIIIGVTYLGAVGIDVKQTLRSPCGTWDGQERFYGDVFYVVDTINKVVDFYILGGQYAEVRFTPYKRQNGVSGGTITQYSGTATYYSSGTKTYGNCELIATGDIPSKTSDLTNDSGFLTSHQDISGKVDKVSGKGLSTNDYTTDEKNKLSGIASGAEVNVQSDWNQTNTSSDDYIKNKPTIPTGTVTNIATGTGLTGGPISTSGTISLDTNYVVQGGSLTTGFYKELTGTYSTIGNNTIAGNSNYASNTEPISNDIDHPANTYWNASTGATLDVAFKFATATTPKTLKLLFGTYSGTNTLSVYYLNSSNVLTKLEDLGSFPGDNIVKTKDFNSGGVSSTVWVIRIAATGWVNARYMNLLSGAKNGLMTAEQASYIEHSIKDNEVGTITISAGDTPLRLHSGDSSAYTGYYNGSGVSLGYLGVNASKKPVFYDSAAHQLAYVSDIPSAVTESTVSGWGFTKNTGTYSKPSGGIPKSDLASAVQTSLGKADSALQSHQSLAAYRTSANQDIIDAGKLDANKIQYSATDIGEGAQLATGTFYFVYE